MGRVMNRSISSGKRRIIDGNKDARKCQAGQVFERQPEYRNKTHHHNTDYNHNGADGFIYGKFTEFHDLSLSTKYKQL